MPKRRLKIDDIIRVLPDTESARWVKAIPLRITALHLHGDGEFFEVESLDGSDPCLEDYANHVYKRDCVLDFLGICREAIKNAKV